MITNSKNLLYIYETLCKHLTKNIIDNKKGSTKSIKNLLKEFFIVSQFGKDEFATYRNLSSINAKDNGIIKSLIVDILKDTDKKNSLQESEHYFHLLNKKITKIFGSNFFIFGQPSPISSSIQESIHTIRTDNGNKKLLLENIDKIIQYTLLNSSKEKTSKNLKTIISESKENNKVNPLVFKKAIEIFNEEYNSNTMQDYELEMIQEYIHIKDMDVLKQSLKNRVKDIQESLETNKEQYKNSIENFDSFYSTVTDYSKNISLIPSSQLVVEGMIKTIADFNNILSSLQSFVVTENDLK